MKAVIAVKIASNKRTLQQRSSLRRKNKEGPSVLPSTHSETRP